VAHPYRQIKIPINFGCQGISPVISGTRAWWINACTKESILRLCSIEKISIRIPGRNFRVLRVAPELIENASCVARWRGFSVCPKREFRELRLESGLLTATLVEYQWRPRRFLQTSLRGYTGQVLPCRAFRISRSHYRSHLIAVITCFSRHTSEMTNKTLIFQKRDYLDVSCIFLLVKIARVMTIGDFSMLMALYAGQDELK